MLGEVTEVCKWLEPWYLGAAMDHHGIPIYRDIFDIRARDNSVDGSAEDPRVR